jgi:1-acyl-sn-glycerol-3-phosphate acyltransferase
MNEAAQRIHDGMSVLIFPEGSRSPDGSIQSFKKGGFSLAMKSKVPIVPVSIAGSREIMPKGQKVANPGRIRIRVDAPINTQDYALRDWNVLMRRVAEVIGENFRALSQP